MLEPDKTRLQTTLNTIKTTDDNLNVRSNLTVDGSIRAKNIIIDDDDKLCLNKLMYPDLGDLRSQKSMIEILEKLKKLEKLDRLDVLDKLEKLEFNELLDRKDPAFEIIVNDPDSKKIRSLTLIKDINNYYKADILISDGKMKVLKRHYHEGLKDIKFYYDNQKKILSFEFKTRQNIGEFNIELI